MNKYFKLLMSVLFVCIIAQTEIARSENAVFRGFKWGATYEDIKTTEDARNEFKNPNTGWDTAKNIVLTYEADFFDSKKTYINYRFDDNCLDGISIAIKTPAFGAEDWKGSYNKAKKLFEIKYGIPACEDSIKCLVWAKANKYISLCGDNKHNLLMIRIDKDEAIWKSDYKCKDMKHLKNMK